MAQILEIAKEITKEVYLSIFLAILSAILCGLFTLIVTYITFRFKRFELKYTYKTKLKDNYFLNAQKHLNEVYIPFYKLLLDFKKAWINLKDSKDFISSVNAFIFKETQNLKKFKQDLEDKDSTVFLLLSIEHSFERLLAFLLRSLNSEELIYKLTIEYEIYTLSNFVFYNKEILVFSKKQSKNLSSQQKKIIIQIYKSILNIINFLKVILPFNLVDYEIKVTVASAPLRSQEFEVQLLSFITDINNKIKDVTLGIG